LCFEVTVFAWWCILGTLAELEKTILLNTCSIVKHEMKCSCIIGTWMKAGIAEIGWKMVREWLMMLLV
jgi:hypothetical protein